MVKKAANRYARQMILKEIGEEGQNILNSSSAAVVGCGALGTVIADHLARAGLGKLKLVDRDVVELENLQRQILFDEDDIGEPKALSASNKLGKINSQIEISGLVNDLTPANAEKLLTDVNIVLDATDNMQTRYLINDVCVKNDIPWIYGGAVSTYGMTMNIIPGKTACLTCAFPYIPRAGSLPTCDTVGVLNTVTAVIASIQATETLKILLDRNYSRELLIFDVWNHDFERIKIAVGEDCKCCKKQVFDYLSSRKVETTSVLCGRDSVQVTPASAGDISLESLAARLGKAGDVKLGSVHLTFETEEYVITIFRDGRGIIKGTGDEILAKSLYAKYIGN